MSIEIYDRMIEAAKAGTLTADEIWAHPEVTAASELLLGAVPEPEREWFVRDAFLSTLLYHYYDWVAVALECGVRREALAEMVLEKLRGAQPEPHYSYPEFVRHFLEDGSGRPERSNPLADALRSVGATGEPERVAREMQSTPGFADVGSWVAAHLVLDEDDPWNWRFERRETLWSVLEHDQLLEALRVCAAKAPHLLFSWGNVNDPIGIPSKLRIRLSEEELDALLVEAAGNLQTLERVRLVELTRLPAGAQLDVARRLEGGSITLVVQLALMLGYEHGGPELCEEFTRVFERGDAADNYRHLSQTLRDARDRRMAAYIGRRLHKQLEADGYVLGKVTVGAHRGGRQMQVRFRGTTYVQDRYQLRDRARKGDTVLIKPSSGHRLTRHVVAVTFMPVEAITVTEDLPSGPGDPGSESGWRSAEEQEAALAALAKRFNGS